jgi:hypothetical protein
MTSAHIIEDLCFDIDFASEDEAFEAQERVMRFAQVRAQQVIAEVFDEAIEPDEILRLERLHVDIGTVTAIDFEDRFADRLRDELQTLLRERRAQLGHSVGLDPSSAEPRTLEIRSRPHELATHSKSESPSVDYLTTGARAELDWFLHFIEHGCLPWHAPAHIGRDIHALAARVLESNGVQLAQALRAAPALQWRTIFRRLVAQFPAQWLAGLGRQIGLARHSPSVAPAGKPIARSRAPREVAQDSTAYSAADATARVLAHRAQLEALLGESSESGSVPVASAPVASDIWRGILRDDALWLKTTLLRLGRSIRVRRRLASALPEEVVPDLLALWFSPTQVDSVLATIRANTSPFKLESSNTKAPRDAISPAWLLATLTYILVDGGALEFSESGYRHSLQNQIARRADETREHDRMAASPVPGLQASADLRLHAQHNATDTGNPLCDRTPYSVNPIDVAHLRPGLRDKARGLPPPLDVPLTQQEAARASSPENNTTAAASATAYTAIDTTHSQDKSEPTERVGFHKPTGSEIPRTTSTAAPDSLDETLTRSRARAQIETVLSELESDLPVIASLPLASATWGVVLRDDPSWLRATLLRFGRSVRARRRLASALPKEAVPDLLALWLSPIQVDTVLATILVNTSTFPRESLNTNVPRDAISPAWLLATLTYILVDGGALKFSKSGYRHSLENQTARRANETAEHDGISASPIPGLQSSADVRLKNDRRIATDTGNPLCNRTPYSVNSIDVAHLRAGLRDKARGLPPPADVPLTQREGARAGSPENDTTAAASIRAHAAIDATQRKDNSKSTEVSKVSSRKPTGSEIPRTSNTVASDDLHEVTAGSRARARIEAALSDLPEFEFSVGASIPVASDTWLTVFQDDAPWLKTTLLRLGRGIRARRRLASALPEEVVPNLLALWFSPTQVNTVLATIGAPAAFTSEVSNTDVPRKAISPSWLLATLTYILVDGGDLEFSESDYRRSLANHTGRDRVETLHYAGISARPANPADHHDAATQAVALSNLSAAANQGSHSVVTPLSAAAIPAGSERSTTAQSDPDPIAAEMPDFTAGARAQFELLSKLKPVITGAVHLQADSQPLEAAVSLLAPTGSEIPPTTNAPVSRESHESLANLPTLAQSFEGAAELSAQTRPGAHIPSAPSLTAPESLVITSNDARPAALTLTQSDPPATLTRLLDSAPDTTLATSGGDLAPCDVDILRHLRGASAPNSPTNGLRQAWRTSFGQRSATVRRALLSALEYPGAAQRLATLLAVDDLPNVIQWLRPTDSAKALAVAARVTGLSQNTGDRTALRQYAARGLSSPAGDDAGPHNNTNTDADVLTRVVSEFLLTELFEEGRTLDPEPFAQRLTAALGAALAPRAKAESTIPECVHSSYFASTGARAAAESPKVRPASAAEDDAITQRIYIANAGVVVVGPYLPRLFSMLGLTNKESFTTLSCAHRAVHLIQYIVTGATVTPEPMLVLNKILCGLPVSAPIPLEIDLRAQEQSAIEEMLAAIIAHWKAIGRTSIAGLRESFLQRDGRLVFCDDGWRLRVESKCFDMLLDRLPWGYATVKYHWMKRVLHVDWR